MANMNVSHLSSTRTPALTPTPNTPSTQAVAPVSQPTRTQSSFTSSKLQSVPEDQEVNHAIQNSSASHIGQSQQLVDRNGIGQAILADLSDQASESPAPSEGGKKLAQSLANFKSAYFTSTQNDVTVGRDFSFNSEMGACDLMMMRHNPLATPQAKKESEMYRAFAEKEHGTENIRFYDDAYKLSKMDFHHPQFDSHLEQMHNKYIPEGREYTVNITGSYRKEAIQNFQSFKQAKKSYELNPSAENRQALFDSRSALVNSYHKLSKDVSSNLNDTMYRYKVSEFRQDIHHMDQKSMLNLKQSWYKHQISSGKSQTMAQMRVDNMTRNGQLYRQYRAENPQAATPTIQSAQPAQKWYQKYDGVLRFLGDLLP